MRMLLCSAIFVLLACSGPAEPECVLETRERRDFSGNPKIVEWTEAGWDCELLYTMPDPIFGIGTHRYWFCSRCARDG